MAKGSIRALPRQCFGCFGQTDPGRAPSPSRPARKPCLATARGTSSPIWVGSRPSAPSRWPGSRSRPPNGRRVPGLEPVVRPRALVAQADPVPGMVRVLIGEDGGADGAHGLPAGGLERLVRLDGIGQAGLFLLDIPRAI